MRTENIVQKKSKDALVNDSAAQAFVIDEGSAVFLMDALSKMYARPEQAILREYLSNALDAHAEKGGELPLIQVTLPTKSSLVLSIRDYGNGITEEEFSTILNRFGKSTKRDSNKTIGGFGLGAKAGFAVTDKFFMTSYQKGTALRVKVFKDAQNQGYLEILERQTTSEPDGLLVEIPMPHLKSAQDTMISRFTADDFFLAYSPKAVEIIHPKYYYSRSVHNPSLFQPVQSVGQILGWYGLKDEKRTNPYYIYGAIGEVTYAISLAKLGEYAHEKNHKSAIEAVKFIRHFSNHVINIPIGSVELPASRENIIMSERSNNTLLAVIENYTRALKQTVQKQMSSQLSKETAIELAANLYSDGYQSSLYWDKYEFNRGFWKNTINRIELSARLVSSSSITGAHNWHLISERKKGYLLRLKASDMTYVRDTLFSSDKQLREELMKTMPDSENQPQTILTVQDDDPLTDFIPPLIELTRSWLDNALKAVKEQKEESARLEALRKLKEQEEEQKRREEIAEKAKTQFTYFFINSSKDNLHRIGQSAIVTSFSVSYYWSEEELENMGYDKKSGLFPFNPVSSSLPNSFAIEKSSNSFTPLRRFLEMFAPGRAVIILGKGTDLEGFKATYPEIPSGVQTLKDALSKQMASPESPLMATIEQWNSNHNGRDVLTKVKSFASKLTREQREQLPDDILKVEQVAHRGIKSELILQKIGQYHFNRFVSQFIEMAELSSTANTNQKLVENISSNYPLLLALMETEYSNSKIVEHLCLYIHSVTTTK